MSSHSKRRSNATQAIFRVMDDQWRTGKELADMAGVERRTGGQRCMVLVNEGVAECRETGHEPDWYRHRSPRKYRRLY